ncbi:hypothetical protein H4218_001357 [Coemansia sp. IMI 209128]|nr:hypothetical protein H4218_001357 [Coemansia sp. IMI 209128]
MLRHHGIDPLFVFDGGPLPSKLHTELERQRNRQERRQAAIKLWNQSKRKQAYELFQRCVEVTPAMAKAVIEVLGREGFRCLVAPYEADAQLAFLERVGVITAAISEDSDLIVFGCRNVIFKMDQYGEATIFDRQRMMEARAVDIRGWSSEQVRRMCILSGCDYLPSVPGVGLKKAHRYVARSQDLVTAVQLMRADKLPVPLGYETEVERAELTFRYQRVYDPKNKCLAFVSPLGPDAPSVEDMPFIGVQLEPHVAHGIAVARLDPFTYLPFDTVSEAPVLPEKESVKEPVKVAAKKAAPVARARSLQSFWGVPKNNQNRPAPPPPTAAAEPVVVVESEVNVRFRNNDQHGELVATTQESRFFSKPPAASTEDMSAELTQVDLSLEPTQVADLPLELTQVADTPAPPASQPMSQCETVVGDPTAELSMQAPRLLRSASSRRLPADARAISLFGQFTNKKDIPEYAKHPTYRKAPAPASTRVTRSSSGPRTPITQMLRRVSDRLPLQPVDDNRQSTWDSSPSAKRKGAVGIIDEVKKFRYHASAPALATLADDDIVDSSASDTENRVISI